MPKDTSVKKLSSNRSSSSPYPCSSNDSKQFNPNSQLGQAEDVKEWEDARCPICLEHPHNAVLLHCSSYEKGCRSYICNTSYRHSNCLDQFSKSSASSPSSARLEGASSAGVHAQSSIEEQLLLGEPSYYGSESELKLSCPLCREEIHGWSVVEAARKLMNAKARSCSSENCDFSGNYSELRKHARSAHPLVRPSEADPERQYNWRRMENESQLEDLFAMMMGYPQDVGAARSGDIPDVGLGSPGVQVSMESDIDDLFADVSGQEELDELDELGEEVNTLPRIGGGNGPEFTIEIVFQFLLGNANSSGNVEASHDTRLYQNNVPSNGFRNYNLLQRMPGAQNNHGQNGLNLRQNSDFSTENNYRHNDNNLRQNNNLRSNILPRMPPGSPNHYRQYDRRNINFRSNPRPARISGTRNNYRQNNTNFGRNNRSRSYLPLRRFGTQNNYSRN